MQLVIYFEGFSADFRVYLGLNIIYSFIHFHTRCVCLTNPCINLIVSPSLV